MKRFKKVLKVIGYALLSIVLLASLYYTYISLSINRRATTEYHFHKEDMFFMPTADLVQRGKHLAEIKGCTDCHGADLSGKIFLNETALGTISATNLTAGKGGIGSSYTNADWLMALRHGVNRQGKPLAVMPSHETAVLSKEDLKAIIAYCKSVTPVDNALPQNKLGPVLKLMAHLDKLVLFPVEKINHQQAAPETMEQTTGAKLGAYLAVACTGCHRANLKGGPAPAPGMLASPNITSSGNLGKWSLQQFQQTLRTGTTPAGHQLQKKDMPWQMTAKYTDKELESVYLYLQSLK